MERTPTRLLASMDMLTSTELLPARIKQSSNDHGPEQSSPPGAIVNGSFDVSPLHGRLSEHESNEEANGENKPASIQKLSSQRTNEGRLRVIGM